jgi:hypothetical protein
MSARAEKKLLKEGRLAFRSATEKDAFEVAHLPTAKLRTALRTENRIKVLMLALDDLERKHVIENARLIRRRLNHLCAKERTAITIRFVEGEKDFSEWDIDSQGCVIDSRPCQASVWCGAFVMNHDRLKVGGKVTLFTHGSGKLVVNHRIAALTPGPAPMKYPDHKPNSALMHEH